MDKPRETTPLEAMLAQLPPPNLKKFLPYRGKMYVTDKGSYSSGLWLLVAEAVTEEFRGRWEKLWPNRAKRCRLASVPKEKCAWSSARPSRRAEFVFLTFQGDWVFFKNQHLINPLPFSVVQVAYLAHTYPKFSLYVSGVSTPAVIRSQNKPIGLIMPVGYLGGDDETRS